LDRARQQAVSNSNRQSTHRHDVANAITQGTIGNENSVARNWIGESDREAAKTSTKAV